MPVPYRAQQSPIDFGDASQFHCAFPDGYFRHNWPHQLVGTVNGEGPETVYALQNAPADAGIYLGGDFFPVVQIHYHAPSEHLEGGVSRPVELHIVHKRAASEPEDDQYAVLGIWIVEGTGKKEVDRFFRELTERLRAKKRADKAADQTIDIDLNEFLPERPNEFYRYEGSLTTKVDDDNYETVRWLVLRSPLPVSPERLSEFLAVGHQAKVKQYVNRRFVLRSFPADESSQETA